MTENHAKNNSPNGNRARGDSLIKTVPLVAAFVFLLLFCIRNIYSYDYWWHIATGRWIIENGIMRADPFSYTAEGAPLVDPYWLAQILLYALGGTVVIFKTAIIALAFFVALLAAPKAVRFSVPAAAMVFLGAFAASERFLCRPEIFTLLFAAGTLWVLFSLSKRSRLAIFAIPALVVLWVNMHPGWVIAPLFLIAFGVGRLLGRWLGLSGDSGDKQPNFMLFAAAGICFAAALVNPYFMQLVTYPFRLTLTTQHEIGAFLEWGSPLPRLASGLFSADLLHLKLLLLVLAGSFVLNYKRFDPGHAAIAVLAAALALRSYRHFGVLTIISLPVVLTNIEPFWRERALPLLRKTKPRLVFVGAITALLLACAYYSVQVVSNEYYAKRELYNINFGIRVSDTSFPSTELHLYTGRATPTKVFNSYELGGYLMYLQDTATRVFIDGRLVHYPKKVFDAYQRVQTEPRTLESLTPSPISVVLIHNMPRMQALVKYLHKNPHWRLSALDQVVCQYNCFGADSGIKVSPENLLQTTYPEFAFLSVGRFYLNVEEYDKAAELLEVGCKYFLKNGKMRLFYGRALAGAGELKEARIALEKAVELLPESAEAHLNLGVACWQLGEEKKARAQWRRVLEIAPRNEQALQYLGLEGRLPK